MSAGLVPSGSGKSFASAVGVLDKKRRSIRCHLLPALLGLVSAVVFTAGSSSPGTAQQFINGRVCFQEFSCAYSAAQGSIGPSEPVERKKRRASNAGDDDRKPASPSKEPAGRAVAALESAQSTSKLVHKIAIQVSQNDKAAMELALNNARNVIQYYKAKGEKVAIEIVAYGPGLHMLRADTSPVKDRIAPMALENPNVQFIACGNTQANQSKAENKSVPLLDEAKVMPSGVVRLIELQSQGYAYVRP
jgi:intracellular sulfur oxidation DsrE/DsrF family protein